jgi:hypothetical protein
MKGISPRGVSEGILLPLRQGYSLDVVDCALADGKLCPAELDRLVLPRKTPHHTDVSRTSVTGIEGFHFDPRQWEPLAAEL